jgi:VanZ family protein
VHPIFPRRPSTRPAAPGWRWQLGVWAPVFAAVAVICVESTQVFSAENTSGWLRPLFERIFGAFQDANWDALHHLMRKSGHFLGYGTVGLTFLRAWLYTLGARAHKGLLNWRLRATALAIASTALVASADELHQKFLAGRTGTPVDVLLDTAGACALCLLVWLVLFRKAGPQPSGVYDRRARESRTIASKRWRGRKPRLW